MSESEREREPVVAGLFEAEDADIAAKRLEEKGIPTTEVDGGPAAEGKLGRRIGRHMLVGVAIALPIGVVIAIGAWLRNQAAVSVWVPLFFITPTIVFVGAFIGLVVAVARGERSVRRDTMVVAQAGDERRRTDATVIMDEAGGEPTEPVVERSDPARRAGRPSVE